MFSELRHHPRAYVQVKRDDPVPDGIPRHYEAKVQYHDAKRAADYAAADPQGRDRAHYNARPAIAANRNRLAAVKLQDDQDVDPMIAAHRAHLEAQRRAANEPKTRTVGTQSIYRENDTQTDPWTPEYHVRPGSAPEVLRLATLSYGQGLPAGQNEVVMIERARAKREWEKTLPEVVDDATAALRVRMMEEQDALEWKWREEAIEEIQAERLKVLESAFAEREERDAAATNAKLEHILAQEERRKSVLAAKRQKRGLKMLRSQVARRSNPEKVLERRRIVAEYADDGSEVYAKVARNGEFTVDQDADRNVVASEYLTTFNGLLDLESSLPVSVTTPRIKVPPKRSRPVGGKAHQHARYHTMLDSIAMQMRSGEAGPADERPLRFLVKIPPPPERPPVPRVEIPEHGAEEREHAVIQLQRLLRGRYEQALMFEGKEQRRDLINELRTTHALEKADMDEKRAEQRDIEAVRVAEAEAAHTNAVDSQVLGEVTGRTIGQSLDFLAKELVRLQEERRVHAFAMLAEKQRRIREAEESGKRQREEAMRAKQDEIFREIAGVHHSSVSTYLEDIIISSTNAVADEVSRSEIRRKAAAIDKVAQMLHDEEHGAIDTTPLGAQTIAADLVSSFLLPEAARMARRKEVKAKQERFLVGAHRELYTGVMGVERVQSAHRRSKGGPSTSFQEDLVEEEEEDALEEQSADDAAVANEDAAPALDLKAAAAAVKELPISGETTTLEGTIASAAGASAELMAVVAKVGNFGESADKVQILTLVAANEASSFDEVVEKLSNLLSAEELEQAKAFLSSLSA